MHMMAWGTNGGVGREKGGAGLDDQTNRPGGGKSKGR